VQRKHEHMRTHITTSNKHLNEYPLTGILETLVLPITNWPFSFDSWQN